MTSHSSTIRSTVLSNPLKSLPLVYRTDLCRAVKACYPVRSALVIRRAVTRGWTECSRGNELSEGATTRRAISKRRRPLSACLSTLQLWSAGLPNERESLREKRRQASPAGKSALLAKEGREMEAGGMKVCVRACVRVFVCVCVRVTKDKRKKKEKTNITDTGRKSKK